MVIANEPTDQPPSGRPAIGAGLALVLFAIVAYYPALGGGFVWDDDSYVTTNNTLRTGQGLLQIWREPTASPQYYPMVFSTFWVEYNLWGLAPFGFHLTNVVLHGLNGVLLWLLLRQLRVPAPWLAAAVFVLHPVHVESVAWVTERKNVLSTFFYFAAALAYFRFSPPDPRPSQPSDRWNWYALALGLFACALLSKTVTCSLPAALLLVMWWKREKLTGADVLPLLPFFALGVSLALVTIWMEKHHVGAAGPEWELSPIERGLIAGRALVFYVGKLFWPVELTFIYPRWHIDAGAVPQYLFPLAIVLAIAVGWLGRARWGKGPLVACLFFIGTLVPALGFIDVYPMRYSFVADHFQYLASAGMIVLLVAAGRALLVRLGTVGSTLMPVVSALVLIVLAALTWKQSGIYRDLPTLWRDTLAKNSDCWLAHNNLGFFLFGEGKYEEARAHYIEAIRLKPRDSHIHYNLGEALIHLGKPEEAIEQFAEAVRLRPDFPDALTFLGVALAQQGRPEEAHRHLLEATRLNPNNQQSIYNLTLVCVQLGRMEEAFQHARTAESLWPWDSRIRQLAAYLRQKASGKLPQKDLK